MSSTRGAEQGKGVKTARKEQSTSDRSKGTSSTAKEKPPAKKPLTGGFKKARKLKPGTAALREIRKAQSSYKLLLTKLPFQRLVKELTNDAWQQQSTTTRDFPKMQAGAIMALQEAAEAFLVTFLEESQGAAVHAKRVTLFAKDMRFISKVSALFLTPEGGRWKYPHA